MELCEDHKYAYVIYDASECPLCKAEEQISNLEGQIEDLDEDKEILQENIDTLEKELSERGENP